MIATPPLSHQPSAPPVSHVSPGAFDKRRAASAREKRSEESETLILLVCGGGNLSPPLTAPGDSQPALFIHRQGNDMRRKPVTITDAMSGITELFDNPPWRLEGIATHPKWSIVKLVHLDGRRLIIPTRSPRATLDLRFATWTPPRPCG